jgi:hypothetical protein
MSGETPAQRRAGMRVTVGSCGVGGLQNGLTSGLGLFYFLLH